MCNQRIFSHVETELPLPGRTNIRNALCSRSIPAEGGFETKLN